ncbi:MAG TPA: O-antigen ligase family protein [Terriglobales bacterium]|nr:O-antigen ligase family protein [Terriglobales bacterium]
MSSRAIVWDCKPGPLWRAAGIAIRPLYLALGNASLFYVAAMAVILFRPPGLFSFFADRIALAALCLVVGLRMLALREKVPFIPGITLPLMGLTALAVVRALREPFDAQLWSIVASKFVVPLVLFHIAILVFRGPRQRHHFEIFVVLSLAYLIFVAIAFLAGSPSLIYPRFILDESLGFHADRARGPFLQAVANGVSLNILGILLLVFSQKKKIVWLLWLALPVAILATLTRAVWIAFAVSGLVLGFRTIKRRAFAAAGLVLVAGLVAGIALRTSDHSFHDMLSDRTSERGPVDARMAVYDAGWAMFQERPFTGWPAGRMYSELARRMVGYHLRIYYVHNTYLALLVEFGLPGLALYGILFFNLFRLSRHGMPDEVPTVATLRGVWPVLLCVYLFNASFVDMAYQFVIGLLFTIAGMLCAREEAAA